MNEAVRLRAGKWITECMFPDTTDALTREQNPAILERLWNRSQDEGRKRTRWHRSGSLSG